MGEIMKLSSIFWFSVLFAVQLFANPSANKTAKPEEKVQLSGISFSKEAAKPSVEKTAASVQKVISQGELSGVNLRVEGASFRKFNLYFPQASTHAISSLAKSSFDDIRKIVDRDLAVVGSFNFVSMNVSAVEANSDALIRQKGAEGLTRLTLTLDKDVVKAKLEHKNLITGKAVTKNFDAKLTQTRRLAHQIAQSVYEEFIGEENIFLLQIAAVKREKSGDTHIVLMDFDGGNETIVADGKWLKSTPTFAPDGKSVLFAVNTPDGQGIVEQTLGSKQFQFRVKKPGLNIDPRILPDNSGMLATLSFEKDANIYRMTRLGTIIGAFTSGLGLNLSPSVSPDGKNVAFVSDRSGTPQIYVQSLADTSNKNAKRVTFKGTYNQTPHFSPDGQLIVFTGRDEKRVFDIFVLELKTERISRITQNQGRNQEPYFTPSGRYVIFTSERDGKAKPEIYIASLNGDHQFRITDANNNQKSLGYYSPVIKPKP